MPEHSSWLTLALGYARETLARNAYAIGDSLIGKEPPS